MSRHTIYTCDNCGAHINSSAIGVGKWSRWNVEVYPINGYASQEVTNVDLCDTCTGKARGRIPNLHAIGKP